MSQVFQVNGDYKIKVSDGGTITLDTGSGVGQVNVTGNLNVQGDIRLGGNIVIGNQSTDQVEIFGEILSSLVPKLNNSFDLGSDQSGWRYLRVSEIRPTNYNEDLGVGASPISVVGLRDPILPQDAATKSYVDNSLGRVDNVLYVAMSGNDLNSGESLGKAKRTIKAAIEIASYGTTIFVKSGDYTEDNPIRMPEGVAIVGDSLRTTTIRPANRTQDIFWVTNGNYITQVTFKDHEEPGSAVAFAPPTEEFPAVAIHTSPYVQNCTSMTTTGCGMRVDGDYVKGLKSMVLDAYTQYNQGGIGIHMLNRGNTQLVSAFTINCDIAILCTDGGFCSLTNSNSSFGNFGLVADGYSEALYSATLIGTASISGDTIVVNNLTQKPNIGDAVSFNGSTDFYTVFTATPVTIGGVEIEGPDFSAQPLNKLNIRDIILQGKEKIQIDTTDYVNDTYVDLDFNQFKCSRDTGLIIDAIIDDMALGTNYKTIQAGISYYRKSAAVVLTEQGPETIDALNFTKQEVLRLIEKPEEPQDPEYVEIASKFDTIADILANGVEVAPFYQFNSPEDVTVSRENAREIIQSNRQFLIDEGIAFIEANLSFTYDKETCQRDIGLIIDAISYDMMFGSNFRTITAAKSYYRANASVVTSVQKTATVDAFKFLKGILVELVSGNATAVTSVSSNMDIIIEVLNDGIDAIPTAVFPEPVGYDLGFKNARNRIAANRNFIKAEVIQFITDSFDIFTYDKATCERDIGLIIDALGYDLMFGSNFRSIVAGRSYYRSGAAVVTTTQKTATLDAFNLLKTLVLSVVDGNPTAESSVAANMDLIIDILDNGLSVIPGSYTIPTPTGGTNNASDSGYLNARNLIESNRAFIKAEVVQYIANEFPAPGFEYEQATCERDIDLILDAVYYDLTYGGNLESIVAGLAYYSNAVSQIPGEESQTISAYEFMRDLIIDVAQNIDVVELQGGVAQATGTAGSLTAATAAGSLIDTIINIIDTETAPSPTLPDTSWVTSALVDIFDQLETDKTLIKSSVTDYIDDEYGSYDQSKCLRDIDLILDAVYYDLTYGGNMESIIAGRSYYSFAVSLIPGEEAQTLAAYEYMKDIIVAIAKDINVPETQNSVSQVTGPAGSELAATQAGELIEDIRTIIETKREPDTILADTDWVDAELVNRHLLLQDEKNHVKSQVTEFIDSKYYILTYDRAICQRDIGLIIDALGYDLMFGSNFRSRTAARSYYRAGAAVVTASQKTATIDAFNKLKEVLADLVSASDVGEASIRSNMDIIIGVLGEGLSVLPAIVTPEPTEYDEGYRNARDLVEDNREFIKAELDAYIDTITPVGFTYDKVACQRDIDLILDALYYDLTYQGNLETVIAGLAYYSFAVSQIPGEETVTIAAYTHMRNIVKLIAQNLPVSTFQSEVSQVTGDAGSTEAADFTESRINEILFIIQNNTSPELLEPDTSWVDPDLIAWNGVLQEEKSQVKQTITDFIDSRYTINTQPFFYNREKCQRDVGLIIDAVAYDTLFGSNFRSITAGRAYYRANASLVVGTQKEATSDAFNHLKELMVALVEDDDNLITSIRIAENMDIILDILNAGLSAVPDYVIPAPTGYDSGFRNARNLIQANREFIKAEVIQFITDNNPLPFDYDQDKCQRDIGLIIDAVGYDMMFGSNFRSITAGRAYYRANASLVVGVQKQATLDSFNYLKTRLLEIVDGVPTAVLAVGQLMDLVLDILQQGLDAVPNYVIPEPSGYSTDFRNSRDLIEANRNFIVAEIVAYITNELELFGYDKDVCERDVGLIIDAVGYDMMFGSNFRSITAGRAYYREGAAVVTSTQKTVTINAFNYLKSLLIATVSGNSTATGSVESNMDLIISILDNGLLVVPSYILPEPTGGEKNASDSGYQNARDLIEANRDFIKAEVVEYINQTFVIPNTFVYEQATCERDIDLILDALFYDLTYGGNLETLVAGLAYYSNAVSQISGEETETIAAYEFMKGLIVDICQNIDVEQLQGGVAQVTGTAGSEEAAITVGDLLEDIIAIIGQTTNPGKVSPDTSWVNTQLVARYDLLQAEKENIKTDVTDFIQSDYSGYDQARCVRDVGYILDSLYYDLTYGGNMETIIAGKSYYVGALSQIPGEESFTLDAYSYLKTLVEAIAVDSLLGSPQQGTIAQVRGTAGSSEAATAAGDLVEIIRTIIDTQVVPTIVEADTSWAPQLLISRDALLQAEKETLKVEITDYINDKYLRPFYDQERCKRDIDYILDAVYYDLTYGGNLETIIAAKSYYVGALSQIPAEEVVTIEAYEFMKTLIGEIAENNEVVALQNDVAQVEGTAGSEVAADTATDLIQIIITFIDTKEEPVAVLPNTSWVDLDIVNSIDGLISTKELFQYEITDYIDSKYFLLVYNREICRRDLGLIIDALSWDMLFNSNFKTITAARSYYRANASVVLSSQKSATIASLTKLGELLGVIAGNIPEAAENIADNIQIMINVMRKGLSEIPEYDLPEPDFGFSSDYKNARDLIDSNRDFIKAEIVQFISDNYAELVYDRDTCQRDVGLIIDALGYDLMFGSNFRSITAARSYYRAGAAVVTASQKEATIGAFNYLKELAIGVVSGNSKAVRNVRDNMNLIIDVLDQGLSALPVAVLPVPTSGDNNSSDSGYLNARNLIDANRSFIKAEVVQYIANEYPAPGFTYEQETCERDIDLILDAVYYDLTYGGNLESIVAGLAYYSNAVSQIPGEESATLAAYEFMKGIIIDIAQDIEIDNLQSTIFQVRGTAGSEVAAEAAAQLIEDIRTIISTETPPLEVNPDLTWVESNLISKRNQLINKKELIKSQVTEFIDTNYLGYNKIKCERDIDLIIDATYYDITYGGNLETIIAGNSYYSFAVSLIPGEEIATLASYEYLKELIVQIGQNQLVTALQTTVAQVLGTPGSLEAAEAIAELVEIIKDIIETQTVPTEVLPRTDWVSGVLLQIFDNIKLQEETVKDQVVTLINNRYGYDDTICARDIGFIVDAVTYDILYGGNSQTIDAGDEYYSAGQLRIGFREKLMTVNTFKYLKSICGACLLNIPVNRLNSTTTQDLTKPAASAFEVAKSNDLFELVAEVIDNGYTSTIVLNRAIDEFNPIAAGSTLTFHQYSLITASGQTFEWVGAGINVNSSLPYLGGVPIAANKVIESNAGKVYWTGTDQAGDFSIGGELVIRRESGTIEGRTFTKSLFAVLTPYILAVGE
jgi:hypothetical protein